MKRLYISSLILTVVAVVGYLLMRSGIAGGDFIFQFGVIAASAFSLINAFWLISKKRLSSGACMYGVLLHYLYLMFLALDYKGAMAMLWAGLGFDLLAAIAKYFEVKRDKIKGLETQVFDTPICYAASLLVASIIALFV